jgi:hypothetical protein
VLRSLLLPDVDADNASVVEEVANRGKEKSRATSRRPCLDDEVRSGAVKDLLIDPEVEWTL